ncbi:hypothetical protein BGZ79_007455 [Entomortierella chlamydospora]|nr:hypothetical protein BGZ79_007455 [Entomortierella chlamydospora]
MSSNILRALEAKAEALERKVESLEKERESLETKLEETTVNYNASKEELDAALRSMDDL